MLHNSNASKALCRACLKSSFRLKPVTSIDKKLSMTIQTSYSLLTGINCSENDLICPKCLKMLIKCSKFVEKCEESDAKLYDNENKNDDSISKSPELNSKSPDSVSRSPEMNSNEDDNENDTKNVDTNIEEEISSVCSEIGSEGFLSSNTCETQSKCVKFHENLEEFYESDFEEYSSETDDSRRKIEENAMRKSQKRPRLAKKRQRPKNALVEKDGFYFCRVCRRNFHDRYSLEQHLTGASIYVPGHHFFFDF
uniref:CSON015226 protein n=1 Tax=Culicoides sonorensis TaxID=179676 RepID=A0A336KW63_CULSO